MFSSQIYRATFVNHLCTSGFTYFVLHFVHATFCIEPRTINSSKSNPCFYADIWGDWREEIIQVTSDQTELRLFTTWYPTDYKFPYLMSDHVYEMSALNQNIGYNQPTQLGYYLGSDLYKK